MPPPTTPDPANPLEQGSDLRDIRTALHLMQEQMAVNTQDIRDLRAAQGAVAGMPNDRYTMGEIAEQGAIQGRMVRKIIQAEKERDVSYDDIVREHERGKDTAGRLGAIWWQIPSAIILAGAGYLFGLFGGHKP